MQCVTVKPAFHACMHSRETQCYTAVDFMWNSREIQVMPLSISSELLHCCSGNTRASIQWTVRCLTARSRETWSHEIPLQTFPIALEFDKPLGSSAANMPVKRQGYTTTITSNRMALRLHEIWRTYCLMNRGPDDSDIFRVFVPLKQVISKSHMPNMKDTYT